MIENLISGFEIIFHWKHLLAIVIGSSLGLVVGVIPGLTATMAVSLILPLTFDMEFVTSIMLLVGAYKGGIFGGSITAILLNTPGTPASAATVLDGYTLTKQGKGVKALKTGLKTMVEREALIKDLIAFYNKHIQKWEEEIKEADISEE